MKKQRHSWWLQNTRKGLSYYVRYVYVLGASLAFLCVPWAYNSCQKSDFEDPVGGDYFKLEQESVALPEPETAPAATHYAASTEFNIQARDNKLDVVFIVDVSCSMRAQTSDAATPQTAAQFQQAIASGNFTNFVQNLAQSGFDVRLYLGTTLGHIQTQPLMLFNNQQSYLQINNQSVLQVQQQLQQALGQLHANTCSEGLGGQANDCECGIKSAEHISSHLRPGAKWVGVVMTDENDRCQQQAYPSDDCVGAKVCSLEGLEGADLTRFQNQWHWYSVVDVDDQCTARNQFPDYEAVSQPEGMWVLGSPSWGRDLFQSLNAASWRSQSINLEQGCSLWDSDFKLSKKVESAQDPVYDADYCTELPCWVGVDTRGLSFNKEDRLLFRWQKALLPGTYKIYYDCHAN